jgi:hypothetical protein
MARVAEEIKLAGIRREAHQAETHRRDIPFPDAMDPAALAAEGKLIDITMLAARAVQEVRTVRGFMVPVFATPAAGELMARLGVEPVVAAAWWACRRENMDNGLLRGGGPSRTTMFLASGPDGAEGWFRYAAAQRPNGSLYGMIYVRDEPSPVVTG